MAAVAVRAASRSGRAQPGPGAGGRVRGSDGGGLSARRGRVRRAARRLPGAGAAGVWRFRAGDPAAPGEELGAGVGLVPGVVASGGYGALAWTAFKVGALSFGGGFVIIPLMQGDAVHVHHWMTDQQFLDAVALGQITPGPVVATVAAVGYAAHGVAGAVLAAAVAFAPSFAFVLLGGRAVRALRASPGPRGRSWMAPDRRRSARSSEPRSRWRRRSPRPGSSRCWHRRAWRCWLCAAASSRRWWGRRDRHGGRARRRAVAVPPTGSDQPT